VCYNNRCDFSLNFSLHLNTAHADGGSDDDGGGGGDDDAGGGGRGGGGKRLGRRGPAAVCSVTD